jgi:5-formyltetrahydrofolate cyclo-ligase
MSQTPLKAELRTLAAQRRGRAFAANPVAGHTLSAVAPRALVVPGQIVSGYFPFRSEIDPRPLMRRLALGGARLALPVTPPKGSDRPLVFRAWSLDDLLAPGHFKVHEPAAHAETLEPDLVLVPLLAFDRHGGRLGYGAGHFDRTLERLATIKPFRAIGLAYAVQEVDVVPTDPHDHPLDAVLTERAYIPTSKAGKGR